MSEQWYDCQCLGLLTRAQMLMHATAHVCVRVCLGVGGGGRLYEYLERVRSGREKRPRERQTDRQRQRDRERQRQRKTDRETETERQRDRDKETERETQRESKKSLTAPGTRTPVGIPPRRFDPTLYELSHPALPCLLLRHEPMGEDASDTVVSML